LTDLAAGIEHAHTQPGAAPPSTSTATPTNAPTAATGPVLPEQVRGLLASTRVELDNLHVRVRNRLAIAQDRLPGLPRLLTDRDVPGEHVGV
jgi:hypothetical protein